MTKGTINKIIPWFNDDFGDDFVFEDVVEALAFYKDARGSFDDLSTDFIVQISMAIYLHLSNHSNTWS